GKRTSAGRDHRPRIPLPCRGRPHRNNVAHCALNSRKESRSRHRRPAVCPYACGMNQRKSTPLLALLALGVVYGDIGTSPLYAAKETFNPAHGIPITQENILGGVSALFWSLMIVVSLKYVVLVLRATIRGGRE